jgi:hypothetical protein
VVKYKFLFLVKYRLLFLVVKYRVLFLVKYRFLFLIVKYRVLFFSSEVQGLVFSGEIQSFVFLVVKYGILYFSSEIKGFVFYYRNTGSCFFSSHQRFGGICFVPFQDCRNKFRTLCYGVYLIRPAALWPWVRLSV